MLTQCTLCSRESGVLTYEIKVSGVRYPMNLCSDHAEPVQVLIRQVVAKRAATPQPEGRYNPSRSRLVSMEDIDKLKE